jgi:uncharacterized repeat protein (TIGR01451 family)
LSLALALCLLGLWSARSQTGALRRITNTTEDGVNVNPSLSGDGRRIAFESTKDIAGAGGNGFHALRADVASDPATFIQMGVTRAPAPGISQDGSIIAFASKDNPLGTNADGNSEIFLFDGTTLRQITNTTPVSASERTRQGNFQPSLTDDGRFIAFSSNRNLANQNADGNFEIYIFDTASSTFAQLTNAAGTVGATDAKISGNGSRVAYIRDNNALPAVQRDLVLQGRTDGTIRVLAGGVINLALTYGRAISDDGLRIAYSADIAANSSQVFLFDGRITNSTRQITALGVRETEVPLHPTISGDGTRIAFATRRPVPSAGTNSDNSVELYTYDIPTGQFGRVTNVTSSVADGFDGSLREAEVVSSLNDDGSIVAFNFPRTLSGAVASGFENNTEIYMTGTAVRPSVGTLIVLNGASFGHEPATTEAVAPDSIAVARGGALSFTTAQAQKQADGTFPRTLEGTTVTVNGRSAQIIYVSPDQINFHVPAETELGTAEVIVTNSEGFQSRGTVQVLRAAPGIFTISGDGLGEGMILNADTLQPGPFDPSSGQLRLVIFATGVRDALQVTAMAGGRALTVESVMETPNMPGMDEVRVLIPADLRGAGQIDLVIRADNRDSNTVTVTFAGDSCRNIVINEVLADPPEGPDGDANRDGARDSSQDEFVELVNRTNADIDISGYELTARSTSSSTNTVRHIFAPGTIFPAGSAIVVFGGGVEPGFDRNNPAFGGAQVFKASSGGLSLTNSGGVITLRQPSQDIVTIFSYGGSTGLNGDSNQSLTRSPDADRDSPTCARFVLHSTVPGSNGGPFSPGTRVNGAPFAVNTVTRIEVSPATATIDAGAKQQFTATAYDANNNVVSGVIFLWQSSNTAVATIDQTGLATAISAGTTQIRASARGIQSAPAILTVRAVERILTSVEVTPSSVTIPVGGTQQFTARGLDQFGNEIMGLTFAWESTNTSVATIDAATGLATGISQGQTTIRATSQGVTGTATLNVTAPTVVINEVLADPPDGLNGDANRDGARDSSDDEFVELVNSTSGGINISGWTIRTRATSGTESVRHTFAANTTLPASEAIVVFGGGTPPNFNPADSAFGCAQVVTASSGGLSLTNSGLTVVVRDSAGNLITQFTYGGSTGLSGDSNQSLTRSPDITGSFRTHTTAPGSSPRLFSPGTRVDGTPFGSCPARLTSVTISPPSASIITGQSTQFTAQAFNQFGQPMTGVTITFASDNTTVATVGTVTTDPSTGIATATVTGQSPGTARITAQASDGTTTVTSSQATVTVSPTATTYIVTGQVKDGSNNPVSGVLITFELNFQGTLSTTTATTDANGNYSSGDLGCQNNVKVTPSKTGLTFTPSAIAFVNSSQCLTGSDTANFTAATAATPSTVVISQVYGGGGNAGSFYKNDFIELFNRGTTAVDISGWSVQYRSPTGTTGNWTVTNLCSTTTAGTCVLQPGQYYLVQEAAGTNATGGTAEITEDIAGTIDLGAGGGKIALVNNTTNLGTTTCPIPDASVIDFVGYGNANCFEGSAAAPATSGTTADFRKAGGCTDTDNNAADFTSSAPNPRNSSSPLNDCSSALKPDITIDNVTVTEGNSGTTNATFTVSLSASSTSTVTVDFATADGTATAGSDYQSNSGTLTFAPGVTTQTITVAVNGDTIDEASEIFFVNLTNASNAVILDSQGQGTITDNDAAPSLSINDVSVTEGNGETTSATFNVTLSTASGQTVTVNYATSSASPATATADNDYQSTSGTLTFTPGQTVQTITVLINGDTTFEPSETFLVNLTTPTNATISDAQGQGTITNDDEAPPVPSITINDVSVAEGNSGTKTLDFTVSLSMSSTETITVAYSMANGTATAGSDYQSTSGTVTFNPGETSKTISITINGDTLVEPDETFFIDLTNASANAFITDTRGVGTITNDDTANLVISQVYGGGGNGGATYTHDFIEIFNRGTTTVNLTGWSVQYQAATGTGAWNVTNLSGTIQPGQYYLVQEASGGTVGNPLPAPDATGTIVMAAGAGKVALLNTTTALSGACPSSVNLADLVGYGTTANCFEGAGRAPVPSATTADFRLSGGCQDTNNNAADFTTATPNPRNTNSPLNACAAPSLSINDVTVTEGDTGTVIATFTVSLNNTSVQTITVNYATADGTATAPADYLQANGILTFNPGDLTKTISVTINGDTLNEPSETFFVNLSGAANATIADPQGQGTITDNDAQPALSINDVTVAEGNSGTTNATFTVTLSAPSGQTVTVNYATADGSATAPSDYQAITTTALTFNPGETTKTVTVVINGDTTVEPDETFFVNLSGATNATISIAQGTGTITNDDLEADLSITKTDSADPVSNGDNITYTLTVTNNSSTTAADSVTVSDPIPANTTFVSVGTLPAGWTRTDSTPPGGTGTITFSKTTSLPASGTATFTITVNVNSSAANNATITNTATVASSTQDATPGNNTATEATLVRRPADLSLSKTVDNATPNVNSNVVFTITVTNAGPNAATGVTVLDQLPAGLTYVSDDSGGFYNTSTGIWTIGTINASASATLNITATATSASINGVTNTAQIQTSDQFDPDSTPGNNNSAEDDQSSVTVRALSADLALSKTVDNSSPIVNDNVVFTINLSNLGQDPATSVMVTDQLPAGLQFVSSTVTQGSYDDTTGIWTVGTVNVGNNVATLTITASVTSTGTLTNTANVTQSDQYDPDTANNQSSATVTPGAAPADLTVTKTDTPDPVLAGNNITYTITVSNVGGSAATSVSLTDAVPTNTTFVSLAQDTGTAFSCSNPGVGNTGNVNCTIATLAAAASAQFTLVVKVDSNTTTGTSISNTATASMTATDPTTGNNSATATTLVNVQTDVAVVKTDSPDPVVAGGNLTYSITVSNNGPSDAQSVSLTDAVPTNTTFVSFAQNTGQAFNCTSPSAGSTGTVTCSIATLSGGTSATFTMIVNVNAATAGGTTITNTASVSTTTPDSNSGNDSSTATSTVQQAASADLVVTKTDSPDPVNAGSNITYTITVTNNGPDAASSLTLTDTVPTDTTFVSLSTPSGWNCTAPSAGGTGTINCTRATQAFNESSVFTLTVNVNSNVAGGSTISNTATASSSTNDPTTDNNSANAQTTVANPTADLSLTKTVNNSTPNIGERVVFTILLNNAGPIAATGVQVTDLLPAGLTFVSAVPSQGTYTSGTGVWNVGTVSVATPAAMLTITATVATIGAKVNTAQVTASGTPDPDSTPSDGAGDDFASVTVTGAANLVINEAVVSPPSSSPPADANDFLELYNKSTQAIDISGMVISYRASTSLTAVSTFTVPGAVGSGTTVIQPNTYLIIVNGASAYGTAADVNASAITATAPNGFDFTAASGGIKIELNGVKLDGLAYQSGSSTVPPAFTAFGEGTPASTTTASGLMDWIRSPNGVDTNVNSSDFRRNGTASLVSEKAANPAP